MSQRQVCAFYNRPQGCRYQSSCRFIHEARDTPSPGPPFAVSPRASHNPRPDNIPNGVCYFHWSGGTCKRQNCWFKHVRSDDPPSASPTTADAWRSRPATTSMSARLSGGHSLLRPAEAKYQLSNTFLKPDFHFVHSSTVNRFVIILASCSVSNKWVFRLYPYHR